MDESANKRHTEYGTIPNTFKGKNKTNDFIFITVCTKTYRYGTMYNKMTCPPHKVFFKLSVQYHDAQKPPMCPASQPQPIHSPNRPRYSVANMIIGGGEGEGRGGNCWNGNITHGESILGPLNPAAQVADHTADDGPAALGHE
jgi:hypothetical protein